MRDTFILEADADREVSLRCIEPGDGESLRGWKNANREGFFFQGTITPEMQAAWFEGYRQRDHDWMFMVLHQGQAIGCMGFRVLEGIADVYNVILGRPEMGGRGLMTRALRIMVSFILDGRAGTVELKVLRSNPAVQWYLRNGFEITATHPDHHQMRLNAAGFVHLDVHAHPIPPSA